MKARMTQQRSLLGAVLCSTTLFAPAATRKCVAPPNVEHALASNPSASAYVALGGYLGQNNDYACAIPAFRHALRLDPKSWQTRSYLGLALLASGENENAARELQTSLRQNPSQEEARMALGAALAQSNQLDAAISEFKVVLKSSPKSVTARDWLAKALISQENYAAAIATLKQAPPDEVLQMDLVIAHSKNKNNDEAIRLLTQMIHDRPASAVPHAGLATIYTQMNRWEEAAKEFREALRLNPQDDLSQVSYAKVLILLSDFKVA